ncbi:MAG: phosphotransferase family protein [Actinomycetota bacterium]
MDRPAPPAFESDDAYEASLRDPSFWEPYARAALRSAGMDDTGDVRTHFPTTHVAARVGDDRFVKLHYEDWFGEDCFQTEREAYGILGDRGVPIPRLLADGALYPDSDGWRWPYLVMSAMQGRALREVDAAATDDDLVAIASFVGSTLRSLHQTPVEDGEYISHAIYEDLISTRMSRCQRDHETWGSLPERFLPQVRDYVGKAEDLIDPDREAPVFIHGDLHGGNVFVEGESGSLRPTGIVDFNDAYEGDRHYDLVAIHAKAFGGDKALLRTVLDAYEWPSTARDWPRRMMAFTLAHDYDMVAPFANRIPAEVDTLDELASLMWDLDAPGLPDPTPA